MTKKILRSIITKLPIYFVLIILFLVVIYPLFWNLMSSIKPESEITRNPAGLPQSITLNNYIVAWKKADMARFVFNSALVVGLSVGGVVVISVLAGYAFSRFRFRASDTIFLFFVISLALPATAIMISEYILFVHLRLLNTYHGLILFYMSFCSFALVMFRNAFRPLPQEIIEALIVDGCGEFRLFWLLFPLVKPTTATVVIFTYVWLWGDFIWPFVLLQKPGQETLMVGLYSLFTSQYGIGWGSLTAGLSLGLIPAITVYFIFQSYFIKGLTLGAVK